MTSARRVASVVFLLACPAQAQEAPRRLPPAETGTVLDRRPGRYELRITLAERGVERVLRAPFEISARN
jgi:hypothetical protein